MFAKQSDVSRYSYYRNTIIGSTLRLGLPVTDEISFSPRYSIYNQYVSVPNNTKYPYNDCTNPIFGTTPGFNAYALLGITPSIFYNCLSNGEASLAIKEAQGSTLTSQAGYTLSYNSLDRIKEPTSGIYAELKQDVAGLGGQSRLHPHDRRCSLLSRPLLG